MKGECKICGQVCEVFQPTGSSDLICSDCYINIGTAIQLYQTLTEIEHTGGSSVELEAQIKLTLQNLSGRFAPVDPERSICLLHSECFAVN